MNAIIVTGSNGGIGTAICQLLKEKGYFVIGTDRFPDNNNLDSFFELDIQTLATEDNLPAFISQIDQRLKGHRLMALINNAAVQILSGIEDIKIDDFKQTLEVNLIAPLALTKSLYPYLKKNRGSVVNIGSIHSKLTKPGFISYATSKSAILGLTQALAVDCGGYVRINAIQPAATATEMLLDGFKSNPEAFNELLSYHPTNSIASPKEIAEAVCFLISDQCPFMNGSVLDINGGIGSRLHDPI